MQTDKAEEAIKELIEFAKSGSKSSASVSSSPDKLKIELEFSSTDILSRDDLKNLAAVASGVVA